MMTKIGTPSSQSRMPFMVLPRSSVFQLTADGGKWLLRGGPADGEGLALAAAQA